MPILHITALKRHLGRDHEADGRQRRAARAVDFLQNYTHPVDQKETYIQILVRCNPHSCVALHFQPGAGTHMRCGTRVQQDIANRQSRTLEICLDDIEEV